MKRNYYLFNPGRMSRRDNTLKFVPLGEDGQEGQPKYLPVEGIDNLYIFGSVDANSALFNFLGKMQVAVHFFDYYEHYTGSFMPKEYLLAGKMQVEQVRAYTSQKRRMHIATRLLEGAAHNMLCNLRYYQNRGRDVARPLALLEGYARQMGAASDTAALMGVEGNCRQVYYEAFDSIISDFEMGGRHKRPPSNEVNALVSFGNMVCYTLALDAIYHTQLNPTVSFLHEPGARRYSLALDLAEVFKPVLVDRLVFRLLNKRELRAEHFEMRLNGCWLRDSGRKVFMRAMDEKLADTIQHRALNKKVSYKMLLRLECYKLAKYILKMEEEYKPLKMWW